MRRKLSPFWIITIALMVFKLAIHLLVATKYELHRDEMLYFVLGGHLNTGFASTPPLIGWLAYFIQMVFGYSEAGLKLFPALAGTASILIIALMIREFGGGKLAVLIAGLAFLASGAFLRSNSLFQPVSFNQFFWLLIAWLVLRMVNKGNMRLWLWIGLVLGVGFLNKYSIVFFAVAMFMALLLSPERKILLSKYFPWAMMLAFTIALPNIIWQFDHNWPVVHHMAELQKHQLVNVTLGGFFLDQILNCAPALFIWLTGLIVLLFHPGEKRFRFLAFAFLFVILLIVLARGKSYYTLGAYSMLFAAGGYAMEKYLRGKWVIVNYAVLIVAVSVSLVFLPLELPMASLETVQRYCDPDTGFMPQRWEDGEIHDIPQDYADMTGWEELAEIVGRAYNGLDSAEKSRCVIYAENYGQASAIVFYGHQYGLPEPISFHDSYLLWAPDAIGEGPLIYINDEVGDIEKLFDSYPEVGRVRNKYFRENGVMVLLCSKAKSHWQSFYSGKVGELKQIYRRGSSTRY